jgi:8-oxo-dGTP pyrophosphatase MutT (NUDIX family)
LFVERNEKAKQCRSCGFAYYYNPAAAVAGFIRNGRDDLLLVVRRAREPAKGTLDLPGGFADLYENAEEAIRREIKEEIGLEVSSCRYIFSIPNIYPYLGFTVHTLDLFFECFVDDFTPAVAADDAACLEMIPLNALDPALFGLESVKKAINIYRNKLYICTP